MSWQEHYSREQVIAKIRRLAASGYTVAEVADFIMFDTTPGMVAGLARRAVPRIVFGKPAPPMPKFVIVDEDDCQSIHYNDVRPGDGRCRYPLWSNNAKPHEKRYCGKPVVPDTSWCPECSKIVHEHEQ